MISQIKTALKLRSGISRLQHNAIADGEFYLLNVRGHDKVMGKKSTHKPTGGFKQFSVHVQAINIIANPLYNHLS